MNPLLKMNPLEHQHKVVVKEPGEDDWIFTVTNAQIFNFCNSVGLHLDKLTNLMPKHRYDAPVHVGNMHGLIVFITGAGKFDLKATTSSFINPVAIKAYDRESFDPHHEIYVPDCGDEFYEEEDEDACDHEDFLVFDEDEHGNKYWCKVCDERFPKHPEDIAAEKRPPKVVQPLGDMSEAIERFTAGMITLTDVAKEFGIACETLSETIRLTFVEKPIYQDQYVLGQLPPVGRVCVDVEPARQSDPLEVEKFFEDMSIHAPDVQSQMYDRFPDIVRVDVNHDMEFVTSPPQLQKFVYPGDDFYYQIEFHDGSVQRVYPKWGSK